MSLTRKMLKAMGIEDEKIDQIIEAHTDVTDSLKADRDKYKADAEMSYALTRELEEARQNLSDARKAAEEAAADPYKEKYEKEHKDFEAFKKDIEAKELKARKVDAYRALLKEAGIAEKRLDAIIKITAVDELELDKDGKVKGVDVKSIKAEYPEFIVTKGVDGANTETPPENTGGNTFEQMSVADKMRYANDHPTDKQVVEWLK